MKLELKIRLGRRGVPQKRGKFKKTVEQAQKTSINFDALYSMACAGVIALSSNLDKVNTQGEELSKKSLKEAVKDDESQMQGVEEESITLPEELVDRILAMVPFPQVYKARALSRSWQARVSPISTQDDEVTRSLTASFQNNLSEQSTDWKAFCPVFVLDCKQGFLAYDRTTGRWPRMPSLSFLPDDVLCTPTSKLQMDGSLLLVSNFYYNWETANTRVSTMHVANVLNQTWKHLAQLPLAEDESYLFNKLVSDASSKTYNVIVFYRGRNYYHAQIYDSASNTWRSSILVKDLADLSRPTYFNGVLYMVVGQNPRNLLAFNVHEGTFEELELMGDTMGVFDVDLVVCNTNLFMTVKGTVFGKTVQVLKIDLKLRRLFEVARGPPPALDIGELGTGSVSDKSWTEDGRAASDGDCIFFPLWHFHHGMVVYNVHEATWSHISFPEDILGAHPGMPKLNATSFHPSLNPFLAL